MIPDGVRIEVGNVLSDPAGARYWVRSIFEGRVWLQSDENRATNLTNVVLPLAELHSNWSLHTELEPPANLALVGSNGVTISVLNLRHLQEMTPEQALGVAAWLVALADPLERRFPTILKAVMST